MFKRITTLGLGALGAAAVFLAGQAFVQAQQSTSYAAVPGQKGGQDAFGAYDPAFGWPKDIAELPGHSDWTFGAGQSVFAESPDRVFYLQRGELPNIERPALTTLPELGPSVIYPATNIWRNATRASLPANGGTGGNAEEGINAWLERGGRLGVDSRWEHNILVFNREGDVIEAWTQWDSLMQRPHFVAINPYDPEKHVWIVDDHKHMIHKFTNDGSILLQSIGTYGVPGADETHFNRPTFMAWLPDSSFVVADGYNGTRVVKFDADGNYLKSWGERGSNGDETRGGYWNNVHGVAVDPETSRIFVNDRGNRRIHVFDEEGEFLYDWSVGDRPASIHLFVITADGHLWAADRGTNKILKYDLEGNFLYSWGTYGDFEGGISGVHGISVDQEGNLYFAQVDNKGGVQKFIPREGANQDFIIGGPVYSAWQ
jgi:hypothetical protein